MEHMKVRMALEFIVMHLKLHCLYSDYCEELMITHLISVVSF